MNSFIINGKSVPPIVFGTWKLENGTPTVEAVSAAISCGYRNIDTAASYGNGFSIGKAIKKCGVDRDELFVSNKLWNTSRGEETIDSCKKNLKLMKLDYFDLYLMHWPASPAVHPNWKEINATTWSNMEKAYADGIVKSIGVSNFLPSQLEELKKTAKTMPMVNQVEFHPGYFQRDTLDYCNSNGILVQAWSPIGSGELLENSTIIELSEKYNKSAAQICIKWCIQHQVQPIVKSKNPERMKQNLDVDDFMISEADMEFIDNMPQTAYSGLNPETITQFD